MSKVINLEFNGYWPEVSKEYVPDEEGVYLLYAGRYNRSKNEVYLDKLIYVGGAEHAMNRIKEHEVMPIYAFAPIRGPDREIAEAALIFAQKPLCNTQYKDNFPFEKTRVNSTGKCWSIPPSFTVP